jgi:predicted DCC family thiol-disulfide oxidoreductase YuxK
VSPLRVSASADNDIIGYGGSTSASPFDNQAQPAASWPVPGKSARLDWDWREVVQEAWKLDPRPIIMFDGDCNLCSGAVNTLLDMDTTNEFRFCSLSSKFGASLLVAHGKEPDDKNSIMVIVRTGEITNDGSVKSHIHQKSDAVMFIASRLQGAPSWVKAMTALGTVAPAAVSNWLLQIIADNRYRVAGQLEESSCRLDFDGEYEGRFLNDYDHVHFFEPLDRDDTVYS